MFSRSLLSSHATVTCQSTYTCIWTAWPCAPHSGARGTLCAPIVYRSLATAPRVFVTSVTAFLLLLMKETRLRRYWKPLIMGSVLIPFFLLNGLNRPSYADGTCRIYLQNAWTCLWAGFFLYSWPIFFANFPKCQGQSLQPTKQWLIYLYELMDKYTWLSC